MKYLFVTLLFLVSCKDYSPAPQQQMTAIDLATVDAIALPDLITRADLILPYPMCDMTPELILACQFGYIRPTQLDGYACFQCGTPNICFIELIDGYALCVPVCGMCH